MKAIKMATSLAVKIFLVGFLFIPYLGCARVIAKPVTDNDQKGIRYWEPYPYLLISKQLDKAGNPVKAFEIVYLPNLCKQRTIQIEAGFGVAEMKPELQNGWMLTAMTGRADSRTAEILQGLGSLVPSILNVVPDGSAAEYGFYPLIFHDNGMLKGFGTKIILLNQEAEKPHKAPTCPKSMPKDS